MEIRNEESNDVFIPNGSIENSDKLDDGSDYRIVALHREISEEFENKLLVRNSDVNFIDTFYVDDIMVVFHLYLITDWVGDVPNYSVDDDISKVPLIWVSLLDAYDAIPYESGHDMINSISKFIENQTA